MEQLNTSEGAPSTVNSYSIQTDEGKKAVESEIPSSISVPSSFANNYATSDPAALAYLSDSHPGGIQSPLLQYEPLQSPYFTHGSLHNPYIQYGPDQSTVYSHYLGHDPSVYSVLPLHSETYQSNSTVEMTPSPDSSHCPPTDPTVIYPDHCSSHSSLSHKSGSTKDTESSHQHTSRVCYVCDPVQMETNPPDDATSSVFQYPPPASVPSPMLYYHRLQPLTPSTPSVQPYSGLFPPIHVPPPVPVQPYTKHSFHTPPFIPNYRDTAEQLSNFPLKKLAQFGGNSRSGVSFPVKYHPDSTQSRAEMEDSVRIQQKKGNWWYQAGDRWGHRGQTVTTSEDVGLYQAGARWGYMKGCKKMLDNNEMENVEARKCSSGITPDVVRDCHLASNMNKNPME